MTSQTPFPRHRGKGASKPLSVDRAVEAQRAGEAARLQGTPLNTLVTVVPRLARRGFDRTAEGEPIGSFRTALTKLLTHRLRELGLPALWVASIETSQGWADHVHVAVHVPTDRQAEVLPKLDAAIRGRFDWDAKAIEQENRGRLRLGHDHLVFDPVMIIPAEQFPGGEGFIDYIVKGALESQGQFSSTVLTISHGLSELAKQQSIGTAHITADSLHRTYAQEAYRTRKKVEAEALVALFKERFQAGREASGT